MVTLRINIDEPIDAKKYITRAEHDFARKLDGAIARVFDGGIPRVIALAGPSCSGKTTTAGKLVSQITEMGYRAVRISIDDFFRNRDDRNVVTGDAPDYDSVDAIDLDCLETTVASLLRGKETKLPHYDFETTRRDRYDDYLPQKNDIYLFEGIQAVYPEVTSLFGGDYRSIFIRVADGVRYRKAVLDKNEIRFLRRIVRDYNFRNATAEFTIHLWQGVRDNEEKNIFPNAGNCDVYIDSFLRYEPFIMTNHAMPILGSVPRDSRYSEYAFEMMEKLVYFSCPFFRDEMIPKNSMFREFIG